MMESAQFTVPTHKPSRRPNDSIQSTPHPQPRILGFRVYLRVWGLPTTLRGEPCLKKAVIWSPRTCTCRCCRRCGSSRTSSASAMQRNSATPADTPLASLHRCSSCRRCRQLPLASAGCPCSSSTTSCSPSCAPPTRRSCSTCHGETGRSMEAVRKCYEGSMTAP